VFSALVCVSAFLECLYVPMEIAFVELSRPFSYTIPVFALDLLLKCRTTFKDSATGAEVTQPSLILKRYVRTWGFFIDLLSTLPIKLMAQTMTPHVSMLHIILIAKALREWNSF